MESKEFSIKINSELKHIGSVSKRILEELRGFCDNEEIFFDVRLAIEEAVRNAIVHGNRSAQDSFVKIDCKITRENISITVEDEGDGFDPKSVPDPTLDENLSNEGGRGVFLLINIMDEAVYNERGNSVTMVKAFK